jgi:cbb3-type cytochrome oxidase maturation protein
MEILYLLIPLSSVLVLAILGVFAWALYGGQFDDLEQYGEQILELAGEPIDLHQGARARRVEESSL